MILLIIEDDALFAELVTMALDATEIVVAATMRQALAFCKLKEPDFIVLDLSLPDSTATETIAKIRELKKAANGAEVTILTGDERPHVQELAMANGADAFVTKDSGAGFIRELTARFKNVGSRPCADRSTVEQIEKRVMRVTQGAVLPQGVTQRMLDKVTHLLTRGTTQAEVARAR